VLIQALTAAGRDAVGARLQVTAGGKIQVDEVRSGGYYISQGDFRIHFGLGTEARFDLAIRWPDGKTETFAGLGANQWIVVRQGKGTAARKLEASSAQ
jgi:hypothetical protein